MTYEEFCEGVGMKVDRKCYERIEAVYMAFDRFETKQAIYDFYKQHDMNGIEALYAELRLFKERIERRKYLEDVIEEHQKELNGIVGCLAKSAMLCGINVEV